LDERKTGKLKKSKRGGGSDVRVTDSTVPQASGLMRSIGLVTHAGS
jgi:hypothetical protein